MSEIILEDKDNDKEEKEDVKLSLGISKEQSERLLKLAKKHNRTKASMIRTMIDAFFGQEFKE